MSKVWRTLEYRRAKWLTAGHSLEQFVRQAWGHFPTQLERTVRRNDGSSVTGLRSLNCNADGFAMHCARYTDDQSVGILTMAPLADAEIGERPPEANENYLHTDFMALVKGNHVIAMNTGRNAASLANYLRSLFVKAGLPDHSTQFELARIGNLNTLAMIEAVGVKAVELRVDIAEAAAVDLIDGAPPANVWGRAKHAAASTLKAIIAQDEQLSHLREAEMGTVNVSINIKKGDLLLAKSSLNHLGHEVAEDEDASDFLVTLRNDQTIRPDEIAVKKRVRVNPVANSVMANEAWSKMQEYMEELGTIGQLEA